MAKSLICFTAGVITGIYAVQNKELLLQYKDKVIEYKNRLCSTIKDKYGSY